MFCRFVDWSLIFFGLTLVYGLVALGLVLGKDVQASWNAGPLNVITPAALSLASIVAIWQIHRLGTMKEQLDRYADLNKSLKTQIDNLDNEKNELRNENNRLEENVQHFEEVNNQLKSNVEQYEQENLEFRKTVDTMEQEVKTLMNEVRQLHDSNSEYSRINHKFSDQNKELKFLATDGMELAKRLEQHGFNINDLAERFNAQLQKQKEMLDAQKRIQDAAVDVLRNTQIQRLNYLFEQASNNTGKLTAEQYEDFISMMDREFYAKFESLGASQVKFINFVDEDGCISRNNGFPKIRNLILSQTVPSNYDASYTRHRFGNSNRPTSSRINNNDSVIRIVPPQRKTSFETPHSVIQMNSNNYNPSWYTPESVIPMGTPPPTPLNAINITN